MTDHAHPRALVVGGGISGIACARALEEAGAGVTVCERDAHLGGRLRHRWIGGRGVDLGAAYFTAHHPSFLKVVEDWADRGLARQWTDTFHLADVDGLSGTTTGPIRWVGTAGLPALVEDLASGLDVAVSAPVHSLGPGALVEGRPVDAIVLAMPDPQAAALLGDRIEASRLDAAGGGEWAPTIVLAAGWSQPLWPRLDGVFVADSPVLTWIADDGSRSGDGAPVLVAHSTIVLAGAHLDHVERAAEPMLAEAKRLLAIPAEPDWVHVCLWAPARPTEGRDAPFLLLADEPGSLLGVCGDGWGGRPRVEGAYLSGRRLGEALAERLCG